MRPALDGGIERAARNPEKIKYKIHKIWGEGGGIPKSPGKGRGLEKFEMMNAPPR